jgi:hypothetical protein
MERKRTSESDEKADFVQSSSADAEAQQQQQQQTLTNLEAKFLYCGDSVAFYDNHGFLLSQISG